MSIEERSGVSSVLRLHCFSGPEGVRWSRPAPDVACSRSLKNAVRTAAVSRTNVRVMWRVVARHRSTACLQGVHAPTLWGYSLAVRHFSWQVALSHRRVQCLVKDAWGHSCRAFGTIHVAAARRGRLKYCFGCQSGSGGVTTIVALRGACIHLVVWGGKGWPLGLESVVHRFVFPFADT